MQPHFCMKWLVGMQTEAIFSRTKHDCTMDFVYQLANDDYVLVEIQGIPENYWV